MISKMIRVVLTAACIGLVLASHAAVRTTQFATTPTTNPEQGQSTSDLMTHSGYMVAVG